VDPTQAFCHNPLCPARGQPGLGNIKVHSHKERRFRCTTCRKTFAASTGTPFYRLHKAHALLVLVVTLLAHGCPLQAIVAAFGLDERTVADWQALAGRHTATTSTTTSWAAGRWAWSTCRPMSCMPSASAGVAGWRWPWPCPTGCGWAGWSAGPATKA
jgi:transposase-like protein